ncbi:MAG: hypothetical protein H0U97_09455 [Gammaproteobacteria bacterium]|nr:hypothetical protein [Gammaproteobacteria bacterium]
MARVAERCARHPWGVLAFALVLSILSGLASARLPVYTSRQALLPKDTEVTRRLDSFLTKFGAASESDRGLGGRPARGAHVFAAGMADGYFAARDGRMLFLFVRARNASQEFEVLGPFIDRVKAVVAATAAKAGAAGRTPPKRD